LLTCKNICDNATRHIEGQPGLGDRFSLRFHLLICKECRRFMRQFRMMIGTSAKLNELDEPTDEEINELVTRLASRQN
jgi:hypothetical protein